MERCKVKKIFTLILTIILIASSVGTTYALESGVKSFSITPIEADQKHKYLYVTIEAPKTHANSKLLVGFYTDGVLKRLTPYDISAKTKFTKQKINTYVTIKDPAGNYFLDQTPDEIKIFTWDQTSLVPKTLCDNVLTQEVIDAANSEVVESLAIVPEAVDFIVNNRLIPKSEKDKYNGEWDENIYVIMEYIKMSAQGAVEDAKGHLLSSLYAQSIYKDNLDQIRTFANGSTSREKNKLKKLMEESNVQKPSHEQMLNGIGVPKKYYDALTNAGKFLDFSLTEV